MKFFCPKRWIVVFCWHGSLDGDTDDLRVGNMVHLEFVGGFSNLDELSRANDVARKTNPSGQVTEKVVWVQTTTLYHCMIYSVGRKICLVLGRPKMVKAQLPTGEVSWPTDHLVNSRNRNQIVWGWFRNSWRFLDFGHLMQKNNKAKRHLNYLDWSTLYSWKPRLAKSPCWVFKTTMKTMISWRSLAK